MAVCLDYQMVYQRREEFAVPVRVQVAVALCLFAALVCKIWTRLENTDLGYQLGRERQKTVELDMQRRELELQLSILLRPDNLSRLTAQRLGLQPLSPENARRIVR